VVDYNPNRFSNPILNGVFQYIDKFCATYCDETWNLSSRMISARFGKKYPKNQKVVPMGCWFDEIKRIPFEKCEKHTVVFMGHVLEKQGVQLLISSIPEVIKHVKDFKVRIIGDGPYRKDLEKLISTLSVSKHVEMLGYVESEEEKYKLISSASLAYALYDPDLASFTYYADPGKIKTYLSCGVPVLVTNVPEISKELVATNSGVILPYDVSGLVSFFKDIFVSDKKLKILRDNAIFMGKKYNFEKIYARALLILNISSK
jgi:glycosyltransferase involved in cell wall biosynthesis